MSDLEELLLWHIKTVGLPMPEREYRFAAPERQFRADFCWKDKMIIAECEGGVWMSKSRHTSGTGFTKDCEKYNLAALMGYRVFRFTTDMVESGDAISTLEKALEG